MMFVTFRPLPLLSNPHVQTILGSLLKSTEADLGARVRPLRLPDGDQLLLYDSVSERWRPGHRIVVLLHGLGGCHRSGYLQRTTRLLLTHGYRVVRLDLRGVGRGARVARRTYNGGSSADVRAALEEVARWSPTSPLVLLGFSLGGNIALKMAGEAAAAPLPALERVAAVSPPIDLSACATLIGQPRNRFYENYFVRNMLTQIRRHQGCFPDLPRVPFPRQPTLRQLDDMHTAPRGGYSDAADYYRRASALPLVPRIQVPTLILTARDDPFIAVAPFETLPALPRLEVRIERHGGHLGFLGYDGRGGIRWAERALADWVLRHCPPVCR